MPWVSASELDNADQDDRDRIGWQALAAAASGLKLPGWYGDALCREYPAEWWFPTKGEKLAGQARAVCERCAVADECLAAALEDRNTAGVWGGTTPAIRRNLRRGRVRTAA